MIDTALTGAHASERAEYPRDDLERAWKQILFNQFHDILPGSAIEPSYDDARDQLGEAVAIAKRIITRAHNRIARRIDIPMDAASQPIVVFNPHPWPVSVDVDMQYGAQRAGVRIVDHDGAAVLSQGTQSTATTGDISRGAVTFRADVPALGYALYRMLPGPALPADAGLLVSDDGTVIENAHLRIELDPETGDLISLHDRSSGVDPLQGTRGQPRTAVCDDPTDTWGHRVISYAWPGAAMTLDRIVVRETGPLRSRVRVERTWGASTLVEEYLLAHDARAVRVDVTIDWREKAHLLKLRFPVGLDDPGGDVRDPLRHDRAPRRRRGGARAVLGRPDRHGRRLAGRPHGHRHHEARLGCLARGLGDSAPSIGITAVRSPVYSWHDPRLLDPDGVYSFQDQGIQRFSLELIAHAGDWRAAQPTRRAAVLGAPVRAQLESFHDGDLPPRDSFADDGGGAVMVTAVKGSEDVPDSAPADLIVRAVETRGESATARIGLPLVGRTIEGEFQPHQVRTFRVPLDPAADIVEVDLLEWPLGEQPT